MKLKSSRFIFLMRLIKGQVNRTLIVINLLSFCFLTFNVEAKEDKKIKEKYEFNIPVQSLSQSLNELSDIAKISFLFPYDLVENKTGSSVKGNYTVQQALTVLLNSSGLEGELSDKKAFLIKPLSPNTNNNENLGNKQMKTQKTLLASIFALMFSSAQGVEGPNTEEEAANDESKVVGVELERITVTARRRTENLQEVPDTVVSMGETLISRANITSARDVTNRIPNVSIVESLSPTSTFIIVRGISSIRNSEPAVAVIVDGVQVGSASEISQSFFDVEQIELLKGPQGALYGRNAIGGALIISSKKPSDVLEGKLTTGIGTDGLFEVSGSLSGPISDELFFRVAGNHKSFDGTIENEYLNNVYERNARGVTGDSPSSSNMDFEENNDFRTQLLWQVSDNTSLDYRFAQNNLEAGAMWYRNIYRLESDQDTEYEFPINSNGNPTAIRSLDTHTFKLDHEFDFGTLTAVSNYTDTNERYGVAGETKGHDRTGNVLFYTQPFVEDMIASMADPVDQEFFAAQLGAWAAGNFVGSDQYYDVQTFSQDIRLVSDTDGDFSYVTGAYLLMTDRADTIRSTWETPNGAPFDCEPAYPGGPIKTDFSTCNGLIDATQNEQDNTAWAVYLSTDYKVTQDLTLTSAIRYDEDKREVTRIDGPTVDTRDSSGIVKGVGACDSAANPDDCAKSGSTISETFSAWQPKFSLAYTPNRNFTYYGTYARGFRSGGFNASGALLTDKYEKETLDSFELGIKSTIMDNRLRANFAAFYQDYENVQQFEFDGNIFVQSIYNIPESNVSGIEGSIEFAATENITINAAFGIMDSEIEKFDDDIHNRLQSELLARTENTVKLPTGTQAAFDKQFKGEKLPNFAHQTANVGIQYSLPLANERYLITRLDYSYSSDRQWWLDGEDSQNNLGLLEASIGLEFAEGFEIRMWCKNCTNKEYDSEYGPNERELFGGAAKDVAYRARGLTAGIKLDYSF